MNFEKVILYGLNKRGLTSKTEILIQAFKQDAEKKIDQTKYKNKMKVNMNMATGFVKKH